MLWGYFGPYLLHDGFCGRIFRIGEWIKSEDKCGEQYNINTTTFTLNLGKVDELTSEPGPNLVRTCPSATLEEVAW